MFSYTTRSINLISLIISIIIFFNINNVYTYGKSFFQKEYNKIISKNIESIENTQEVKNENNVTKEIYNENVINFDSVTNLEKIEYEWGIAIPKIELIAPIEEGTTSRIMNKSVGHFIDTSIVDGNVCLAAHNRGYEVNYFQNIKTLRKGDIIIYKKDNIIKKYKVETTTIIRDTDWTYLENTQDNRITLITCVENEPEYRRCIQGLEISEVEE